jgi:hypothetical protein
MATKKVQEAPLPQTYEERLAVEIASFQRSSKDHVIPTAAHNLQVGDLVQHGRYSEARIEDFLDDRRIVILSYEDKGERNGVPYDNQRRLPLVRWWVHVHPLAPIEETRFMRPRIKAHYSPTKLDHFIKLIYMRGVIDNPDYQRDYVWTLEDKQRLIRSVFNRTDIGRFIFVELPVDNRFEVIDGKQRLEALMEYYEGRFAYEGKTFHQLSWEDKFAFGDLNVEYAQIDAVSVKRSDILWLFLTVNTGGVPQTDEHVQKVREMYATAIAEEQEGTR